ncbi:MAG: HEAT repeat domain-containing protein, partial [Kiritimatiellae bacterium]|nr:HEAT repeat domain-containing protein [Kiritimatiellia bacterium]
MKRVLMWTAVVGLMGLAAMGELKNPVFDTDEAGLLAVLRSDAAQDDKVAACQTLCFRGTGASVQPLADLLKEETPMPLFHAARYGLENIPDAKADAALLAAAGRVKGLRLAGVMQSCGNRKVAAAVPLLATGLTDADPAIVRAAAGALAKIRTPEALAALRKAAPTVADAAAAL